MLQVWILREFMQLFFHHLVMHCPHLQRWWWFMKCLPWSMLCWKIINWPSPQNSKHWWETASLSFWVCTSLKVVNTQCTCKEGINLGKEGEYKHLRHLPSSIPSPLTSHHIYSCFSYGLLFLCESIVLIVKYLINLTLSHSME